MGNKDDNFKELPSVAEIAATSGMDSHPLSSVEETEWHVAFCDLVDPFVASREVLTDFQVTAPNGRTRDWLQGIIDVRTMYSVVTGIEF